MKALHAIDFYKAGHVYQYPKDTRMVFSNWTARSNKHFKVPDIVKPFYDGKVVQFGVQAFVKSFLIDAWNKTFFELPKEVVVKEYLQIMDAVLGKGRVTSEHIEALHDLGYLPLVVKALPEGASVPMRVPSVTLFNTKPEFFWITNYIETVMSSEIWPTQTCATIAKVYRNICDYYAEITCDNKGHVPFQCHDFSARGTFGYHAAELAGVSHLTSFQGTDSMSALGYARDYYAGHLDTLGFAVAATEHAVMCMGTKEDEIGTYDRLISEAYPEGIVSIVSDTWNLWDVLTKIAPALKDKILARNGKVVFRPDSGNPVDILCGYPIIEEDWYNSVEDTSKKSKELYGDIDKYIAKVNINGECRMYLTEKFGTCGRIRTELIEELTPEMKGAVQCLYEVFGGKVNSKGFIELCDKVGLLYGESITPEIAVRIFERLKAKGFASNSTLFGIGSYAYQYNTRDTFGMAMKATAGVVGTEQRSIFKDPITDSGLKRSAKGFLRVVTDSKGEYVMEDELDEMTLATGDMGNELKTIFKNGKLLVEFTLDEVRKRVSGEIK